MPDLTTLPKPVFDALVTARGLILVVFVTFVVLRLARVFVHGVVRALMDREASEGTARELSAIEVRKRSDTIETLATNAIRAIVILIAGVTALDVLSINIGPAIAGLGVVGIAVGFGAQSLVRDYFNGALIIIENQFSIGDIVDVAGVSGSVEDFSLRRTTLRDINGIVHTVPNGEIKVTSNKTRVWARVNLDVMVAYGTDIERTIEVVEAVGRSMTDDPMWKRRILEPPRVERIEALGEFGITLKILGTVRAQDQWSVAGELRKRLLVAFGENGIEIPRPQRVILAPGPVAPAPSPGPDAPAPAPTQDDLVADDD